jgi:heat shock protein HslJ
MKKILISVFVAVIALSACHQAKDLENREWKLESMGNIPQEMIDEAGSFTIIFNSQDKRVNGKGACNSFFAGYELECCNEIDVEMMGSTRAMCPGLEYEDMFFKNLDEADSYKIKKDGKLYLYDDKAEIAVFN